MSEISSTAAGRVVRYRSQDDLLLAARIFGAPSADRLPLLCLPGLSRNSLDFLAVGARFASGPTGRLIVALDYRGRGMSQADPDWRNYTPLTEANDVLAATTVLGIHRAIILGTSRGGIIAMILGGLRPSLLSGVILNDIGPVIEGMGLARIKTYLTAARTMRNWDEAIAAVRQIAGKSFVGLHDADWRAWAEAIFTQGRKGLEPSFDRNLLNVLASVNFTDAVPALWPQFDSLRGRPLLAIRGERSDLLSERTLAAMQERNPDLQTLTVPGQGHAPLLRDSPTLDRIAAFLAQCDGEPPEEG